MSGAQQLGDNTPPRGKTVPRLEDLPGWDAADPDVDPADLAPPAATVGRADVAHFGRRLGARFLDTLLVFFVVGQLATGAIWGFHAAGAGAGRLGMRDLFLAALVQVLIAVAYEGLMLNWRGQTLGKMAFGLRVVDAFGAGPGAAAAPPRIWLRSVVYYGPYLFAVGLIGIVFWLLNGVWQLWDQPLRQCLHDKAARTAVVRV